MTKNSGKLEQILKSNNLLENISGRFTSSQHFEDDIKLSMQEVLLFYNASRLSFVVFNEKANKFLVQYQVVSSNEYLLTPEQMSVESPASLCFRQITFS